MKTLVDTNVLLDIITQDKAWCSWSEAALRQGAEPAAQGDGQTQGNAEELEIVA